MRRRPKMPTSRKSQKASETFLARKTLFGPIHIQKCENGARSFSRNIFTPGLAMLAWFIPFLYFLLFSLFFAFKKKGPMCTQKN